jgi:cobalamin-dependent methionine synthase I
MRYQNVRGQRKKIETDKRIWITKKNWNRQKVGERPMHGIPLSPNHDQEYWYFKFLMGERMGVHLPEEGPRSFNG